MHAAAAAFDTGAGATPMSTAATAEAARGGRTNRRRPSSVHTGASAFSLFFSPLAALVVSLLLAVLVLAFGARFADAQVLGDARLVRAQRNATMLRDVPDVATTAVRRPGSRGSAAGEAATAANQRPRTVTAVRRPTTTTEDTRGAVLDRRSKKHTWSSKSKKKPHHYDDKHDDGGDGDVKELIIEACCEANPSPHTGYSSGRLVETSRFGSWFNQNKKKNKEDNKEPPVKQQSGGWWSKNKKKKDDMKHDMKHDKKCDVDISDICEDFVTGDDCCSKKKYGRGVVRRVVPDSAPNSTSGSIPGASDAKDEEEEEQILLDRHHKLGSSGWKKKGGKGGGKNDGDVLDHIVKFCCKSHHPSHSGYIVGRFGNEKSNTQGYKQGYKQGFNQGFKQGYKRCNKDHDVKRLVEESRDIDDIEQLVEKSRDGSNSRSWWGGNKQQNLKGYKQGYRQGYNQGFKQGCKQSNNHNSGHGDMCNVDVDGFCEEIVAECCAKPTPTPSATPTTTPTATPTAGTRRRRLI